MESAGFDYLKLEIFIPESHFPILQSTLQETDAGHIGKYDSALSCSRVTGYWRPLEGARPFNGTVGEICCAEELKVEVTIRAEQLDAVMHAILRIHPYEEPVVNVIPLYCTAKAHQQ